MKDIPPFIPRFIESIEFIVPPCCVGCAKPDSFIASFTLGITLGITLGSASFTVQKTAPSARDRLPAVDAYLGGWGEEWEWEEECGGSGGGGGGGG